MEQFLNVVLSMPTAMFTVSMGFVAIYWIFMIIGAVDIDSLDAELDLDFDGDIDVDLDMDLDVGIDGPDIDLDIDAPDVDVDIDAPDVDVDGPDLDADADVDVDGPGGVIGIIATVLSTLGLAGIPLTITLSVFMLASWVTSAMLALEVFGAGEQPIGPVNATIVFAASVALGTLVTSISLRPLRGIFVTKRGRRGADELIGDTVRIVSGRVTPTMGNGAIVKDGVEINISIRCEDPHNGLERNDEALVIGYDNDKHIYFVEPLSTMLDLKGPAATRDVDAELAELENEHAEEEHEA